MCRAWFRKRIRDGERGCDGRVMEKVDLMLDK